MTQSLKDRFQRFVTKLDGFENIDELLNDDDPHGKKRADYMFAGRSIIVEQKTLEIDPNDKPQKFIDRLMEDRPVVGYGRFSTSEFLSKHPNGRKLYRDFIHKLTAVIEEDVSNADKQTRDTRQIFSIPNAAGVLIVLNEAAHILDPQLIRYRLQNLLTKKLPDGSPRYPHNDLAITITEIHPVHVGTSSFARFEAVISPTASNRELALSFAERLKERLSAYCGRRFVGQITPPKRNLYQE